ncbi:division/cell wall cluster transcriptional repressor MraZ [Rapidithrix thailandica]|uniref:Transcriptional regulator MraZ n=1 Tax=Rapidithrix thailandica TaxID=413964 RepID=A0AAW9RVQ5_9BACT
MPAFYGKYDCKIDAKGRLTLPARIKNVLADCDGEKLMLVKGFEPCLTVYTEDIWVDTYEKVMNLNPFDPQQLRFQRSFFAGCMEVEPDKSSRILIPKDMLQYAQMESDIHLIGVGNRLELWSAEISGAFIMPPDEMALSSKDYLGSRVQKEEPVVVNINKGEVQTIKEQNSGK